MCSSDLAIGFLAYRYLISYYLINKDDKNTAKEFAAKLQEIDPENETAKQVLELK